MKVHELIEKLKTLPQDADVLIDGYEYGMEELSAENVYECKYKAFCVNDTPYAGPHEIDLDGSLGGDRLCVYLKRQET